MNEPCEFLPWDSEFFGVRIGRVRGCRLTSESAAEVCAWVNAHAIDCLYFVADPADSATLRLAPRFAFDLIDLRVTLACSPAASTSDPSHSPLNPAGGHSRHGRFAADRARKPSRLAVLYTTAASTRDAATICSRHGLRRAAMVTPTWCSSPTSTSAGRLHHRPDRTRQSRHDRARGHRAVAAAAWMRTRAAQLVAATGSCSAASGM